MLMAEEKIASKKFLWQPDIVEGDDRRVFSPNYVVRGEAVPSEKSFRSKFADLPTFGMWADRIESDDELLEGLDSGWRGFATKQ